MGNCLKNCFLFNRCENGYSKIPEAAIVTRINSSDLKLPVEFAMLYEMGTLVGQGTTSSVYKVRLRGRNTNIDGKNRDLACKIIDKSKITFGLDDEEALELLVQLRKEANILRAIDHPNIVSLYDFAESATHLFFVEELLQGGELFDHLVHHGPLSEALACQLLFGVFSAVSYLHQRGIVHRDIKAENLIFFRRINGEFSLKIIDFGFSTELRNDKTGTFLGTGGYIAPEIRQHKLYSTSVDNWGLGVLLFCCLAARLPFPASMKPLSLVPGESEKALQLKFPEGEWKEVSEGCKRLITQLLQIDPVKRMTAAEALHDPWFQKEFVRLKGRREDTLRLVLSDVSASQHELELPELSPTLRHSQSVRSFRPVELSRKNRPEGVDSCKNCGSSGPDKVSEATSMSARSVSGSMSDRTSSEGSAECSCRSNQLAEGETLLRGLSPKSPLSYWAIASHALAGHLLRTGTE